MVVVVFSLFINLAMLAPSIYMLQVYDRVIGSSSMSTLVLLTLMLLFLVFASGGLEWARAELLRQMSSRMEKTLNPALFDIGHRQALYSAGALPGTQPLQDLKGIRQFMSSHAVFAFVDAPWLPVYLILMFLFHPLMGALGLASAVLLTLLTVFNERVTRAQQQESEKGFSETGASLAHIFRNGEVIRAMGMLEPLRAAWLGKYDQASSLQNQSTDTSQGLSILSKTLRTLLQSIVLGLGAYLVIEQKISPGMMVAGSILLGRALAPIDQLTGSWKQFVSVREQYQRLEKALKEDRVIETETALPAPKGEVRIENITVTPPGQPHRALLQGISVNCVAGSVIGVIGPSGSGKSSLARALLGIWPCAQGTIRLDGVNIFEWKRQDLGQHLGYLPQDIELFEGTVAENIARFNPGRAQEVVQAAQMAGVHEMILRFENGYETRLGPGGVNLSGGQRQRIGLARAIFGLPKLVVLDEPNSNLDRAGEAALIQTIQTLKQHGSTTFMMTHNLALLSVTDSTVVLADGALSMMGPTDKVLARLTAPAQGMAAPSDTPKALAQSAPASAAQSPSEPRP